ncbi:hypothetical protein [Allonocardiopsis opalescens]|uniref:Uncharacterized protein n=1 Tax=Allonocardiopsis opalescens TaxID=1144618 RepID=A0A2T0Q728_9ACTN|nr:hypothetical protein [Allonocardiopsis opalescens]PRX99618.1 hypothetical protein CLV72_103222 [Allonocardiopsis opalescens]
MASLIDRIKRYLRSPQGRQNLDRAKRAARDPRNRRRLRRLLHRFGGGRRRY